MDWFCNWACGNRSRRERLVLRDSEVMFCATKTRLYVRMSIRLFAFVLCLVAVLHDQVSEWNQTSIYELAP